MSLVQDFNIFEQAEKPAIVLCNPNGDELFSLSGVGYKTKLTLRYNSISDFEITIPEYIEINGTKTDSYDYLEAKRLIWIENIGYFVIIDVDEELSGMVNVKNIAAQSIDSELNYKKLSVFGGTYKFYNGLDPLDTSTLMGKIISLIPSWTLGTVSADLWDKSRNFDIKDSTIYNFLVSNVETAYDCIFYFDIQNKIINVKSRTYATTESDVYLSFNNLIDKMKIKTLSDEIVTCLHVYGAGDLDIRTVNPLGTVTIYNFDYYKTLDWMSQGLIDAINAWETLVDSYQIPYADLLTLYKNQNIELNALENQLVDLQNALAALDEVRGARIEAKQPYADIQAQIVAKEAEITAKKLEISAKQTEVDDTRSQLLAINTLLSFSNNFTDLQLVELGNYIIENTYQNENFLQTDIMTPAEIQEIAQMLYDQAQGVLGRVAQPKFQFDLNLANLLFLPEYKTFAEQLEMGSVVYIELKDNTIIQTVLLEVEYSYDEPNDFSMTFANKLRLASSGFIYSDLFGQAVKTGANVNFSSANWANWTNEYRDDVSSFITSALDASKNAIINSENQDIIITKAGLKGRRYIEETDTYSDEQVWLTNTVLAFTDDNWNTAKTALGKTTLPDGNTAYGLVAEVIIGNLIAGNELRIQNEDASFIMDGDGLKISLNNTQPTSGITVENASTKITLNPTEGITITKKLNSQKMFYIDSTTGDLTVKGHITATSGEFTGKITANSGSIGGLVINSNGIQKDSNNYMRSDGSLKWGALSITGSTATFEGTIKADKLVGQIDGTTQVIPSSVTNGSLAGSGFNAGKFTLGSMLGDRISGGTARPTNINLGNIFDIRTDIWGGQTGGVMDATGSFARIIGSGNASLTVGNSYITIVGGVSISESVAIAKDLSCRYITAGGRNGLTTTFVAGTKTLYFQSGILYDVQ